MTTEVRRVVALSVASALMRAERSSRWLAARSGIALSDLERKLGLQADFTVADLADIADALGVAVADFVPPVRAEQEEQR